MKIKRLHDWKVDLKSAREIQERFRGKMALGQMKRGKLQYIAGVDVAWSEKTGLLYGAVVVMELPSLFTVETAWASLPESFPYIPGYLSFREGPVILEAFANTETIPDAVIFDGQGLAHPRGFGIASHIGLFLDIPSLGCAKTRLTGSYNEPGRQRGDYSPIFIEGREVGAVLRTRKGVKPVFVSPGYKMGVEDALRIVLLTTPRYRIPEPIRKAHHLACKIRDEAERPLKQRENLSSLQFL